MNSVVLEIRPGQGFFRTATTGFSISAAGSDTPNTKDIAGLSGLDDNA
jgi:hypothetical protein